MRPAFVCLLVLAFTAPAHAQDTATTVFDFEAAAADQSGDYTAEAGAELTLSLARLAARAGWDERGQSVRASVELDSAVDLTRPVLQVAVSDLPAELRSAASTDGSDVAAWAMGTAWDRPIASGVSMASGRGLFHVRAPAVPTGMSSFLLYAGSRMSAPVDELVFFTDPTPTVRTLVSGGFTATDVQIVSAVTGNVVDIGGTTETLGAQEGRNRPATALGLDLVSSGPIAASWIGAGGDTLAPESMAGTDFVIPSPRYDEAVFVVSLAGPATLTFAAPALGTVMVPADTAQRIATLVADTGAIVFSSDVPVVVVRGSDSGDITPIPPAANELVGVISGTVRVAAGAGGANLTYHRSDGTNASVAVPANGEVSLSPGSSQGAGPAVRISSDAPIGAITYGDADGGEAIALLPPSLLGRDFVLPSGAQFVIAATALPNVTCRLLRPDGSELANATAGAFAPPHPGYVFFGSAVNGLNVPAPSLLRCDGAAWAAFEEAASDVEKLLFSSAAHRAHHDTNVTLGALETRFDAGVAVVETPDFVLPRPATSIATITTTEDAPFGGRVGYQVSLDGGTTWQVASGGALVEATGTESALAGELVGVTFAPSGTLRLRVVLETDGRADPFVDEVQLEATLVPPPTRLELSTIDSPQRTGQPFDVTVTAVDDTGAVVAITADVEIAGLPAEIIAPLTVQVAAGRAGFSVTPLVGASAASLTASLDDLRGGSNEFVIEVGSDTFQLEAASGDGQVGAPGQTLTPFVVRVSDADGAALEGVEVTFALGTTPDGGGTLSATSATTDAMGLAQTTLTLDGLGEYSVLASPTSDPSLSLAFRASAIEEGGCDCRAAAGRSSRAPAPWLLVLLLGLVLYRAARRR